jgi:hypothetical protein
VRVPRIRLLLEDIIEDVVRGYVQNISSGGNAGGLSGLRVKCMKYMKYMKSTMYIPLLMLHIVKVSGLRTAFSCAIGDFEIEEDCYVTSSKAQLTGNQSGV